MKEFRVLLACLLASFFLMPTGSAFGQLQTPKLPLQPKLPPLTAMGTVVVKNLTGKTLQVVELQTAVCTDLNGNGRMDEGECTMKTVYSRSNVAPGTVLQFSVFSGAYTVHYVPPGGNMLYTEYQSVAPGSRVEFPLR